MTKPCKTCGEIKEVTSFAKAPSNTEGRSLRCNKCLAARRNANPEMRASRLARQREGMRKLRAKPGFKRGPREKELRKKDTLKYRKAYPEKMRAQWAIGNALRRGSIKRQPCVNCGVAAQAHHEDYGRKLDVIWLCPVHHSARHMEIGRGIPLSESSVVPQLQPA